MPKTVAKKPRPSLPISRQGVRRFGPVKASRPRGPLKGGAAARTEKDKKKRKSTWREPWERERVRIASSTEWSSFSACSIYIYKLVCVRVEDASQYI